MDQQNDVGGGLPPTAHTHTHFAIFLGRKEHGRFGGYGKTAMTTTASAVLTNYVLPKHGSFLFLWVGEICYFDILSNCEQEPACHILQQQLNRMLLYIHNYQ